MSGAMFVSAAMSANEPMSKSGDFEYHPMSVDDALASPMAKQKLDGTVKFFFGAAPHPAVAQSLKDVVFKEKAGFMKTRATSCNEAFVTVLADFQERAKSKGADAVINLRSSFKKQEVTIDKTFACYPGGFRVGVVLKGELVKLAPVSAAPEAAPAAVPGAAPAAVPEAAPAPQAAPAPSPTSASNE